MARVGRGAAFFDLDKTVIAKASMMAFGRPFYRQGLISRGLMLRALWGHVVYMHVGADEARIERMRESVLALTKGWQQTEVGRIVRDVLDDIVQPIIYAEALELIEEHKAANRPVFIVSASPAEIVGPLSEYLGADAAIASRARVDDDGRYTGEMAFYAYGPHKADAMREAAAEHGIDLAESWAYSDSATDIPMLEAVGHPVAVNPDRELARFATERGWEVRRFVRPVRLRDRVPVPPAAPTAAVASVMAAATAGGLLWWRRQHAKPAPPPSRTARTTTDLRRMTANAAGAASAGVARARRLRPRGSSWRRPPRGRRG